MARCFRDFQVSSPYLNLILSNHSPLSLLGLEANFHLSLVRTRLICPHLLNVCVLASSYLPSSSAYVWHVYRVANFHNTSAHHQQASKHTHSLIALRYYFEIRPPHAPFFFFFFFFIVIPFSTCFSLFY